MPFSIIASTICFPGWNSFRLSASFNIRLTVKEHFADLNNVGVFVIDGLDAAV